MLASALSTQRVYDLSLVGEHQEPKKDAIKVIEKYGEIYGHTVPNDIEEDIREIRRWYGCEI
ncbi:hypothetical protein GcM3_077028 [Golovinomyces cichoracearum]|uniref:Uncharacterized protein n=1 Tax=Golovinomyces cichoracearum TaxID=62708 RepID=A0A420IQ36_9PEZI|nr:hypothetical protein GcM3_077028 [Golovinomyces cichoracearum]